MLQRRRFLAASALAAGGVRAQPSDFWARLREGGNVVLMRHARTEPGVGDPPDFRLGECATQRNLSAEGREQARRIGEAFQREAIRLDEVRNSAWCRCVDTAQLAFGRQVVWPPINSFFGSASAREAQTREVLAAARALRAPTNCHAPGEHHRTHRRVPGHGRGLRDAARGRTPARAGAPDLLTRARATMPRFPFPLRSLEFT
jgi:hypothetical protein